MKRFLLLLLVAGCTADEPAMQEPLDPVVVYASYADKTYLPGKFSRFTDETGIVVIVRHAGREEIVDDLIADEIVPPADVIITHSVRGITRAADDGWLRPIPAGVVTDSISQGLLDSDGFWVALAYRVPVFVRDPRVADLPAPETFDDLANEQYRGRLCLSSSSMLVNRTVIATLINERGVRDAELLVRGWAANLATTPPDSEAGMLRAIEEQRCAVGVASSTAFLSASTGNADLHSEARAPAGAGIDVETAGIGRHARNPDGAAALIAWMLEDEFQQEHSMATLQSPASESVHDRIADRVSFDRASIDSGSANVAWMDEDAVRLAERARFP
ncbi:MAG: extracellular solute-binding protein [Woeseiaceae bacterium]|nr:extracellular solute-binding protein [Woeseiaceae bacterium]